MTVTPTSIPEVVIIQPRVYSDARGFFFESFNEQDFSDAAGARWHFVQDNHSQSTSNVLRGLHYQIQHPQGKLVRVLAGEVFDVAVDLRSGSATFRQWVGTRLSAENKLQLWIPPGFAHGFLVTSDAAEVLYKTTDYYAPAQERTIVWNDADLGIAWPICGSPILSEKDAAGARLSEAEVYRERRLSSDVVHPIRPRRVALPSR